MRTSIIAFASSLVLVGCSWTTFSDLENEAWVDSQEVAAGSNSDDRQFAIGPSAVPGDDGFEGPEFMVVGLRSLTMETLKYSPDGSLDKIELEFQDKLNAAEGNAITLVATRPQDGMVAGALEIAGRQNLGNGYQMLGEISEKTDSPGNDLDAVTDGRVALTELAWGAMGTSKELLGGLTGDGVLDVFSWSDVHVNGDNTQLPGWQGRCQIPSEVLTPNNTLAVWDGAERLFFVGGEEGLASAKLPEVVDDPCDAAVLDIEVAIDGPIVVGNYLGGADDDVFAVAVGSQVRIFTDVTIGGGLNAPRSVSAPSGASGDFGEAIAVGDFDDDGETDLAVGDPGEGVVYIYLLKDADPLEPAKVLSPVSSRQHFGKSLAAVPFDSGAKDLLVVGNDNDVFTYFRIFTSEESNTDNDPRN